MDETLTQKQREAVEALEGARPERVNDFETPGVMRLASK